MVIYRYLSLEYLKILFLAVFSIIAVLITTRLQEIAHFAALGAPWNMILKFTWYQIPYILPIALPIASLIGAIVLTQRLSSSHELTALRASGLSLRRIFAPILFCAAILCFINFYIVSELATKAHLSSKLLEQNLQKVNPLLLLQNKHLSSLHGIHVNALGPWRGGNAAQDLIIAMWNNKNKRVSLLTAKKIIINSGSLIGNGVTAITSIPSENPLALDNLAMENIQEMRVPVEQFTQFFRKGAWRIHSDHLQMSLLLADIAKSKDHLKNGIEDQSIHKRRIQRNYSEIMRRVSLSLAIFTFTLMGIAFGIRLGRRRSRRGVLFVVSLAVFYLVSYFSAKGFDDRFATAAILYLVPHGLIIFSSIWALKRISKGIA
jgi:lipopolysaccharide export system permease protein